MTPTDFGLEVSKAPFSKTVLAPPCTQKPGNSNLTSPPDAKTDKADVEPVFRHSVYSKTGVTDDTNTTRVIMNKEVTSKPQKLKPFSFGHLLHKTSSRSIQPSPQLEKAPVFCTDSVFAQNKKRLTEFITVSPKRADMLSV